MSQVALVLSLLFQYLVVLLLSLSVYRLVVMDPDSLHMKLTAVFLLLSLRLCRLRFQSLYFVPVSQLL
ncbi:hypothetical protein DN475_31055 [Burkholderia multivorans]|nr:hypothetical protein DN475_31055 [Burkholderia multivorans]